MIILAIPYAIGAVLTAVYDRRHGGTIYEPPDWLTTIGMATAWPVTWLPLGAMRLLEVDHD